MGKAQADNNISLRTNSSPNQSTHISVSNGFRDRSINPTIYSRQELQKRVEQKQSFITRVLSQDVLWLKGETEYKKDFKGNL